MELLNEIQPKEVFYYFDEICKVPRPSKKEGKIIDYLINFAEKHSLKYDKDEAGNVVIFKPAVKGMENVKTVVLQSHVDMVAEKNGDVIHNFEKDPIQTYIDNGWIKAKGTTLGADCGIGMAASLALLAADNVKHGAIECLFTVDEETGLTGAKALQKGFFTGKILLNLDSEDDGELFIGCAGGIDTIAKFTFATEDTPTNYKAYKISVTGLLGGHSGDDINKERGNAIKILNRFLWRMSYKYDFRTNTFDGGNLRNAIPREAYAIIVIHRSTVNGFVEDFESIKKSILEEYISIEKGITIEMTKTELPDHVIDETTQFELLATIQSCPSGVISMSKEIPNLVETSTNLASIKFKNNSIKITTSQRSSVESRKYDTSDTIRSLFSLTNALVHASDGYPGWKPNTNSEILNITKEAYKKLFNGEPQVKAIHAGLECGLFLEKYPDLDMISFGPTIRDAHSPNERLEISTVGKFWELLKEVLGNIPA